MSKANSPENSPPSPPPPDSSSSPPSPPNSSSSTPSPSPSAPPPDASSSSPPPPQENSSPSPPEQNSSPPPPEQNSSPPPPSSDKSSSLSPPPPKPSSDSGNSNASPPPPPPKSSSDSGSNGNDRKNFSPPPPLGQKDSGHGSHSPPRSLGPPGSSGSSSSDNDNLGTIIGVAAGAGLLLLVMILLCCWCCRKKKRKSKLEQMQYYGDSAFAGEKAGGDYYNDPSPQQQYHQGNHVVNLPPPPGTNRGQSPPGNWGNPSSPQVPVSGMTGNSSDMSSSFSGPHGPSLPPPHPSVALGFNKSTFTYDELAVATQGFSQANLLGQGGFGYVHKGVLPNGKDIAVKSLKLGSGQGEREFQAEVEIISRVHHRHLVSLVGYCIAEEKRMLVYEFLPNDTLEFHLHGKGRPVMEWPTRHKIALGSAKGLAYLHEDCHPRIIHRDIKASNILLDFNFEAKVADFGLAKLSQDNFTHVSTRVMGTFGYLAPEYASSGKLTDKSDVFSFGVMLLELITGRRPVDLSGDMDDSLVDWARPLCLKAAQDGDYSDLVDPMLEGNYDPHEMARMVACAAAAVRHSARRRPKMSQIVRALEGDASLDDLNEGVKPGQSSYFGSSTGSSDYDTGTYSADMRQFRKLALQSRDYASSEFGATSEYGLEPSSSSSEEMQKGSRMQSPNHFK